MMSPTVLYRAWDYTHEKMLTKNITAFSVEGTNIIIQLTTQKKAFEYIPNAELLPFTGQTDSEMTPIFSGDILAFCFDREAYNNVEILAVVEWSSYWNGWILWNWNALEGRQDIPIGEAGVDLKATGAHIVGNKFEHKHLLTQTNYDETD